MRVKNQLNKRVYMASKIQTWEELEASDDDDDGNDDDEDEEPEDEGI